MWNIFRKAPPKIGLTLGSGGAKGMAHLGALKAFAEEGITFDVVTGTSIGSIVGAAYAMGMSWEESLQAVKTSLSRYSSPQISSALRIDLISLIFINVPPGKSLYTKIIVPHKVRKCYKNFNLHSDTFDV